MAAVVGSRLLSHIMNSIHVTKAVLWSDSQIVLNWLCSKKTLKPFIANRVKDIRELTDEFSWRYCPSESNPADLLSRGITAEKLRNCRLWMEGPEWLIDEHEWPKWNLDETQILFKTEQQENIVETLHVSSDTCLARGVGEIVDLNRFNSFKKLLRVTAYVIRFVTNCRTKDRLSGTLSAKEIQRASIMWIRNIQSTHYLEIIRDIRVGQGKSHNIVKQLKLYLDEDDIIRCEGRIHNAPLEEQTKFPILLPAKEKLTQLIVVDAHVSYLHSGLSSTVTLLRQTYWIPSIRQVVNSVIHKCVVCRKVSGRPYSAPDPPPLPKDRLKEAPPFTVTGVDFTGALNVKDSHGQISKCYICLFTCANTRAVHLEIVADLTEETFILAFRRFVSRKSLPKIMISDNATTYVAAAKHIEKLTHSRTIIDELNNVGTTWNFIPKRAPWYGGFWERLIGLTKDSIKKVLGRSLVNIDVLRTIVTENENILNDRPLTYVSSDPLDEPLTPSHLLYGRRITSLPYPDNSNTEYSTSEMTHDTVNKLSKVKSQIIQQFWNKWRHEYLTSLREYHRHSGRNTQKISVGDVVQVYEDSPRTKWTLAVIDKLNVGGDNLVRSAVIRTKYGLTSRPITKLYPLEVETNTYILDNDKSEINNLDSSVKSCRRAKFVAIENIKRWTS